MAQGPTAQLQEDAILWAVGEVTTDELVRTACDALIAGLDTQALRELAGSNGATSHFDIDDLLRSLAEDIGLEFWSHGSEGGRLAAALVFASRCVAGGMEPRQLAGWMHERIGHGHPDPRVEALVSLDDRYDIVNYTRDSVLEIDAAVLEAAHGLVASSSPI